MKLKIILIGMVLLSGGTAGEWAWACPPHTYECNGGCIYSLPDASCQGSNQVLPANTQNTNSPDGDAEQPADQDCMQKCSLLGGIKAIHCAIYQCHSW